MPNTGRPFSMSATFTVNSPLPPTNSRVPSNGSTSQWRGQARRVANGAGEDSSETMWTSGVSVRKCLTMTACAAKSAAVTGERSAFSVTSKRVP